MALCMPFLLRRRTSRVYQDHLTLSESPNFLRSAYPYPGCRLSSFTGSCPMENIPAGYRLILWFCCYWLVCLIPFPAPSGGRFPGLFLIPFSFPVTAEFNPHRTSISAQFNCNKNILYLSSSVFYAVCSWGRLMSPISFSASYATPVVSIL